jgi:hypothetical protein
MAGWRQRPNLHRTVKAPAVLGTHVFRATLPAHERAGVRHDEAALAVPITTLPHGTSLAAWDIPSPVLMGRTFSIKVGAKSVSGHSLEGCPIAIRDDTGAVVGQGKLQGTPWPGTTALYWTSVDIPAPNSAGVRSWSVTFDTPGTDLPHEGSSAQFSFAVVAPSEHKLTVMVVEKESKAPIENALVRLGAFRAETDQAGMAHVHTSKGTFDLIVWKAGYESSPLPMEINTDLVVEVEAVKLPEDNPDTYWTM